MRMVTNWIGILYTTFALAILGCAPEVEDIVEVAQPSLVAHDETVAEGGQTSLVAQDEAVVVRAGVLVFQDVQALQETLERLSRLSPESLRGWNRSMGFVSLREVFDEVVEQEAAIDEYYERLARSGPEGARLLPREPVRSQAYLRALQEGRLRVIREAEGDYFDYNIREVYLAPVLDPDGRVAIGGTLIQYVLDGTKRVPYTSPDEIEKAKAALDDAQVIPAGVQPDCTTCILPTVSQCRYYSNENNGWSYDGNRRFRAWVELDSHTEWSGRDLYVTNVLRFEGMKKNWLGSWRYSETYTVSLNLQWDWWYRLNGYAQTYLPVPSSSRTSPWSEVISYMNNATLAISPHTNGYYTTSSGTGVFEPVVLSGIGGSLAVHGTAVTLYPGQFGGCTIQ